MAIVTRNILYRNPINFAEYLPVELVYQIVWYLPARDLKSIRLVNKFLAQVGLKNVFWSDLCKLKWSEYLCLETLPVPSPHVPERNPEDCWMIDSDEEEVPEPVPLEEYLLSMKDFREHTYDELKPATLYDLTHFFPAFHFVEGSWLRAFNLVIQHMEVSYLHNTVRENRFSVSDTQWEFRFSREHRSSEPHSSIHAFLDYRRDHRLHIVHGHKYWDEPFHWRPVADGTAIRVHEFPAHRLDRNSDGYRTMTNQWVCMTSSSEHSFVRDLGELSRAIMRTALREKKISREFLEESDHPSMIIGDKLLEWIDAYALAPGNERSCWVGAKKKLTCMTWRDVDTSDEDEE